MPINSEANSGQEGSVPMLFVARPRSRVVEHYADSMEFNPYQESLVNPRIEGDTLKAQTRLHFSPWSGKEGFVHGADAALCFGKAFEVLTGDGKLERIVRMSFSKAFGTQLDLTVSKAQIEPSKDAVVFAELLGKKGERVWIQGVPNGQPITDYGPKSSTAILLVNGMSSMNATMDGIDFVLPALPTDEQVMVERNESEGMRMQVYMDMISHAYNRAMLAKYPEQARLGLVVGYSDLQLPTMTQLTRPGGLFSIRLNFDSQRKSKIGMELLPVEVEFMRDGKKIAGGTCLIAYTFDLGLVKTLLEGVKKGA